jgi:hypothetical protein
VPKQFASEWQARHREVEIHQMEKIGHDAFLSCCKEAETRAERRRVRRNVGQDRSSSPSPSPSSSASGQFACPGCNSCKLADDENHEGWGPGLMVSSDEVDKPLCLESIEIHPAIRPAMLSS